MRIPKGIRYDYKIRVLKPNETAPEDVTGWSGTFKIYYAPTGQVVLTSTIRTVSGEEKDGQMYGYISGSDTDDIELILGMDADNNYSLCDHSGFMSMGRSGASTANVEIDRITFYEAGA